MIPNKLTCLTMGRKIKNLKRCYFKFYIICSSAEYKPKTNSESKIK